MFIEAKDDGGGGNNWTTGATSRAKLQSNHHHQQTNIQFLTRWMSFLSPTNSVKALKGKVVFSSELLKPFTDSCLIERNRFLFLDFSIFFVNKNAFKRFNVYFTFKKKHFQSCCKEFIFSFFEYFQLHGRSRILLYFVKTCIVTKWIYKRTEQRMDQTVVDNVFYPMIFRICRVL